ncbi:MAG: ferritin [Thermoplasmata archaeon]|nr:MAG: ferritin [Thermoplasmata archaeon]
MGEKAREIVGEKAEEIVEYLNKTLADEWLAYYQYWIGARVARGRMRGQVVAELLEHAGDELRHAEMLVDRIIQLGGTPLLSPKEWFEKTNCGYESPTDPSTEAILRQNIKGERCAIGTYREILKMTKDVDEVTYALVLSILKDEIEHEEDLQSLLDDMAR